MSTISGAATTTNYRIRAARSVLVLVAGVTAGTLAVGACGTADRASTPATSAPIDAATPRPGPPGVALSCLADYCAGLRANGASDIYAEQGALGSYAGIILGVTGPSH